MPRWVKDYAIIGLLALALLWAFARPRGPAPEGPAPALRVQQTDGRIFDLLDARGQPVLLVFWAEWCGSCKSQVPALNELQRAEPGLRILGLAVDSGDNERVRLHAQRHGIDFPVAAAQGDEARRYGVAALPTNVFVGPDGQILASHTGPLDLAGFRARLP